MSGPLKNHRHEAFAQARARGLEGTEAWLVVRPKVARRTAWSQACRFAKDIAICARIEELSARATNTVTQAIDRLVEEKAGPTATTIARIVGAALTQAELLAFVTNIVLAKPSDLNGGDSMLVESIKPGKYGDTLEVCDKLRAAELAAKLQGFLVDKSEVVDKTPREPLDVVRARVAAAKLVHGRS